PVIKVGDMDSGASTVARGRNPEDPDAGIRTRTRSASTPSA
ncbi:MAG: hypothetical protein RL205_1701, partial [Actinomycetota bacterium]